MKVYLISVLLLLLGCGGKPGRKDDPNRHKLPIYYSTVVGQGNFILCPNSKYPVSVTSITKIFSFTEESVQKLLLSVDGKTNILLDVKSKEDFELNNRYSGKLVSFVNSVTKEDITLNFVIDFNGTYTFSYTLFSNRSVKDKLQSGAETIILQGNCSQLPLFFEVELRHE